jgi:hypothetical protein
MMPDLRAALRATGGRRVTGQVVKPKVIDNKVSQNPQSLLRATCVLTPMSPRKISIKEEGQRDWKWWTASSAVKLELGWFILPDHDKRIKYEVMQSADWGQARVYIYDFVETAR